jgi:hypothetical protein
MRKSKPFSFGDGKQTQVHFVGCLNLPSKRHRQRDNATAHIYMVAINGKPLPPY